MAEAAKPVHHGEELTLPALWATAFPLVVWLVSGIPVWFLTPLVIIAMIAWGIVLREATRRRAEV